jgi:hypothetical protein
MKTTDDRVVTLHKKTTYRVENGTLRKVKHGTPIQPAAPAAPAKPPRPEYKPRPEKIRAKQIRQARNNTRGMQGERIGEIKSMRVGGDSAGRVERLVQLAKEFGPQKLRDEIAVHERKIADLRAALDIIEGDAS